MIGRIVQDVRYSGRIIGRHPAFSAIAVLTLALGIGATTAILTVVNSILLRPMSLPDSDRLVVLYATTPARGIYRDTTSFLDFSAWRDQGRAFTAVAAFRSDPFNITGDGTPEPLSGVRASHELLSVLGVSPLTGRFFNEQEQHAGAAVALISHELWTRRYGGDPGILRRSVLLNEIEHLVIGVLPPKFQFPPYRDTDVIIPVVERTCRSCGYLRAVGRLKSEVPVAAAQRELDNIAAGLAQAFPKSNTGRGVNVVTLQDVAVGDIRLPVLVLLGAGLFVLLIGCGNVGNLVLARGISRQRELAIRSALGAGVGRLVWQLLIESVSLALIASLLGIALAMAGSRILVHALSLRLPLPDLTFDWTLLASTVTIALLSGVISGLPPAFMVWKGNLSGFLNQGGWTQSPGVSQQRLRNLLVVVQTALSVMLLVGAGLLLKSFVRLQQVDLGLNARQTLTADLLLSKRYAGIERRASYVSQLLDSLGTLPGVQAVAIHIDPPVVGGQRETFRVEGHQDPAPDSGHPAGFDAVNGRFFEAMDMPVIRGRAFAPGEGALGPPVAVINETMARQFWPQGDAIGKRLQFYYDKNRDRWMEIVGITRDVRYRGRFSDPIPQVFVPGGQPFYDTLEPYLSLVIRTAADPGKLAAAVQTRIWAVDKDQPILRLQPLEQVLHEEVAEPRVYALLVGLFATIALVIAAAGIYGLSAFAVVRRRREIGIRLAVGATPADILKLVLRHGMVLVVIGVAIGVGGSLALTKIIAGILYGVTPTDATTFVVTIVMFSGVAALATLIPAIRATRIDPTLVFRYE